MSDTSDTSATRATGIQHECNISNTSATQTTRVRHKCCTNDTSVKRVKIFDFDIISHPYVYYMASERLQEEEQVHSKYYRLQIPRFHAKRRLKSAPQKINFLIAKATSKICTLDCSCKCPCMFPYSYAQ